MAGETAKSTYNHKVHSRLWHLNYSCDHSDVHCTSLQVPDFDLDQTELKRGWKICYKCKYEWSPCRNCYKRLSTPKFEQALGGIVVFSPCACTLGQWTFICRLAAQWYSRLPWQPGHMLPLWLYSVEPCKGCMCPDFLEHVSDGESTVKDAWFLWILVNECGIMVVQALCFFILIPGESLKPPRAHHCRICDK